MYGVDKLMNQLKTVLLLGGLSILLVLIGGAVSPGHVWVFFLMAVAMNFGAYFFSDKMVLAMAGARELPKGELPWLRASVEELSLKGGIPAPRIFIIPGAHANAFATGRNPAHGVVAFSEGLLQNLSQREVRGVAAHELGHIMHRDILLSTIAATLAAAIGSLANVLQWGAMFGGGRASDDREGGHSMAGGLALAFIAPLIATLLQMAVSRSREYLADEQAAQLTNDPGALVMALQNLTHGARQIPGETPAAMASLYIVNPFGGLGGSLMNLFSTHPPMEQRIARLQKMMGTRFAA